MPPGPFQFPQPVSDLRMGSRNGRGCLSEKPNVAVGSNLQRGTCAPDLPWVSSWPAAADPLRACKPMLHSALVSQAGA